MKFLLPVLLFISFGFEAYAGSKRINEDLDETGTVVVVADTGIRLEYIIDKVACVCVANTNKGAAAVPCKNLAAHPALKQHVGSCK